MSDQNDRALPSDRAVAASPSSQQAVSPVPASIPSAGMTYRLRNTEDPEERLEDAAMFKALHDVSRGKITATKSENATFGAVGHIFRHVSSLPYWDDPAFLSNTGRQFSVVAVEDLDAKVSQLHASGKGAFIKSTVDKHYISRVPVGADWREEMDAMIFSFIDGGPKLMVQELVDFTFEYRFFVVDRQVVAWSPAAYKLTPLDYPTPPLWGWRKQADEWPVPFREFHLISTLAGRIASSMREPTASFDIGMIGPLPAVVEFNPLCAGQIGLFACDVRSLAAALYAQAIEARRAETQSGSVHESAVPKACAPEQKP